MTHLIPRFGLPNSLQSDSGPAFISQISQQVATALGIDWHLHIPYQPQSSGKVERVNGIIKTHLTKLTSELRLSWVDLLPLALTRIRTMPHSKTGLTSFELLYGRPYLLTHLSEGEAPPLAGYLPLFSLLRSLLREHADRVLPQPPNDKANSASGPGRSGTTNSLEFLPATTSLDGAPYCNPHHSHGSQTSGTRALVSPNPAQTSSPGSPRDRGGPSPGPSSQLLLLLHPHGADQTDHHPNPSVVHAKIIEGPHPDIRC